MTEVLFDSDFEFNSLPFINFCNSKGDDYYYQQLGFLNEAGKMLAQFPRIGHIPHEHVKAGLQNQNRLEYSFSDGNCDMRLFYMIQYLEGVEYVVLVLMQHKRSPIKV